MNNIPGQSASTSPMNQTPNNKSGTTNEDFRDRAKSLI